MTLKRTNLIRFCSNQWYGPAWRWSEWQMLDPHRALHLVRMLPAVYDGLLLVRCFLYGCVMDKADINRTAPTTLRAELERSREDLAAGRLAPLHAALTAIQRRAFLRMEHQQVARAEGRTLPEPG